MRTTHPSSYNTAICLIVKLGCLCHLTWETTTTQIQMKLHSALHLKCCTGAMHCLHACSNTLGPIVQDDFSHSHIHGQEIQKVAEDRTTKSPGMAPHLHLASLIHPPEKGWLAVPSLPSTSDKKGFRCMKHRTPHHRSCHFTACPTSHCGHFSESNRGLCLPVHNQYMPFVSAGLMSQRDTLHRIGIYLLGCQKTLTFVSNRTSTYGSMDFRSYWYWESDPFDTGMVSNRSQCLLKLK